MHSIDTEGVSAAMLPHETTPSSSDMGAESSQMRGIEILRFQPAQVEFHGRPKRRHSGHLCPPAGGATSSGSVDSVRSNDSDSNETQSLMPASTPHTSASHTLDVCDPADLHVNAQ